MLTVRLNIDQYERSHALDANHHAGLSFDELDVQRLRVHFVHIKRRIQARRGIVLQDRARRYEPNKAIMSKFPQS